MKPVKIDNEEVRKAINAGNGYIQIDGRKFLLLEVEEISDSAENSTYMVTNPEEEKQLLQAVKEDNPILSDREIDLLNN
jgi:hypothetical protein